jgi:hypothetical protein
MIGFDLLIEPHREPVTVDIIMLVFLGWLVLEAQSYNSYNRK